ncbi:hypothetical protein DPEC_G00299630 [Dallia pectoralis]|uniref:Uncharacterized protein n=1 Tax=Dallia pectoralis TaxID=75939 RepID=A0ACC2FG94_DALPE|nr:hypothetical protein DPEC_G00299630 [Dallia pectoralis]
MHEAAAIRYDRGEVAGRRAEGRRRLARDKVPCRGLNIPSAITPVASAPSVPLPHLRPLFRAPRQISRLECVSSLASRRNRHKFIRWGRRHRKICYAGDAANVIGLQSTAPL